MQLAAISEHSSPELLFREAHNAQGRFCVLTSQIILNVQRSARPCNPAKLLPAIPALIPACVRSKSRQQKFPWWWAGNTSGCAVGVNSSSAGWQIGGNCYPPRFCPSGVRSGHHKWEQQLPSTALCCQQHLMSGTRLLFFFCKFTKSLMSLSHLLPQPPVAHFPFYFCCLSPLKLSQL